MDVSWIWQTLVIFAVGTIYLRISGRKSISQMTMPQVIIMISLGTLIIQPVTGKGLWTTFGVGAILVFALIFTEFLQLKSDRAEKVISGKSLSVIENGEVVVPNLKKLRLTVDKLETRLRQNGIVSIEDVETATMEVSGQLGYTLKTGKQPATKEDIQQLIQLIQQGTLSTNLTDGGQNNIFTEVADEKPSPPPPNYLQ